VGFRLHLIATVHGIPIAWALTGAKADEREVLDAMLDRLPLDLARRIRDSLQRQALLGDKNSYGKVFETDLTELGIDLIRPTRSKEKPRPGQEFLKPLRQIIESIFDTLKEQLDLERHAGRTLAGVSARISQRLLALTTAIWHNDRVGAPVLRSLTVGRPLRPHVMLGITHLGRLLQSDGEQVRARGNCGGQGERRELP